MDAQERDIFIAVLAAAIILGLIIAYFFISIFRQQKLNVALQKKSMEAQINALERERARIAIDLHDEIGPMLSGIKLKINSLDVSTEDQELVDQTNHHIDRMLQRMREISFDLMPDVLIRKGLTAAIDQLVNYVSNENLKIRFSGDASLALDEERSVHLYRIVQEIFHNTVKHAEATELHMELKRQEPGWLLTAKDNGKGFDLQAVAGHAGLGLRSLFSRTELLGGEMHLESAPGKGTFYQFKIPSNA